MPLYNWIKCTEEGKYEYVCKEPSEAHKVDIYEAWTQIYDEYITRYGLHKLYKRLLQKMKEKALLELEYVESGDRFKLTLVELAEVELKQMLANKGEGMSIREALVYLSKWVGYRLDPKEITVIEFFNLREEYGKANKKVRHSRK